DRNGLRPMRYTVTHDGLLVTGSETGMVKLAEERIAAKGRVGPGQCIAVDLESGRFFGDAELKDELAARKPFGDWTARTTRIDAIVKADAVERPVFGSEELRRRQVAVGYTLEELEAILHPMVEEANEAVGSMGDDTPVAVLSQHHRGLHHYFRQTFSQVTNPPIDSLRETRVMTLKTRLGNLGNILDEDPTQCDMLMLDSPVLSNAEFDAMRAYMGDTACEVDCTFAAAEGEAGLRADFDRIRREAEEGVRSGCAHVVLSDQGQGPERAPIPMILAVGAVHTHLVRHSLRTFTSVNVRAAEALDVHYAAVLIGAGATTVNAYLAQESIADRHRRGLFGDLSLRDCVARYKKAMDKGLLKVMSKMGISVLSSYRGGMNFEAIGLSRALVNEFFPGVPSRISGIGLSGIARRVLALHSKGWDEDAVFLPVGGLYKLRRRGESHAFDGGLIHTLQRAVETDSYTTFKRYSEAVRRLPPVALRDLLDFRAEGRSAVPLEEVESITEIRKRLLAPGISLGALSPEAHETLSIAMNRIGARSDSGEGGEDPARAKPRPNGDNANSAIKQIASGRFGVTAEYLNNCREIEIKVAQGAKPGEGGQLPGFKVSGLIAKLRHSTPGVTLISPPPHHDIYSIEDLAQLIYDLKQINPEASVCVKLVSRSGIGTIAAGVAKAKADAILISGHSGGTGASPQSSIKYAGLPWEMGLSETHQVLLLNRLRHRVKLRTDGGIKTGRDVVVAAMLGAEEFGIGTASLVAMGCIMVRQCHSNTCPVGVCTQDETLRKKFAGSPEKVINLFSFVAEEVREILASLGFRRLTEVIGRTELLKQVSRGSDDLDDLDLNPLLVKADAGPNPPYCVLEGRNEVPETLDADMIRDAAALFEHGEKMQLQYNVRNTHRAIGTKISSRIVRKFGMEGLQPGHLSVRLRGSAGQSLGAFAVRGLKLVVFGDANDYVGKGLSGGTIVVRPAPSSTLVWDDNAIVGNTVLYGATAGELYAGGQAGERFAVRNSGATTVVEGCGANGCEYMTGGSVVILGPVGDNFGAGFTGGVAFVYDRSGTFEQRVNPDTLLWSRVSHGHWDAELRALIGRHVEETGSRLAARILNAWDSERGHFWHIVPKEYARY
ncbi:MAG TPA: glutamate synthase large subunit, partial [Acetobacteraceae bacterium]|nr:glutamate synthase large subunit [Acetobacteraceae bacterium]